VLLPPRTEAKLPVFTLALLPIVNNGRLAEVTSVRYEPGVVVPMPTLPLVSNVILVRLLVSKLRL
jgi:hypothetical protein